ncbi:ribonuclease HII [Maribacter algarum]|uniref:Ribonuclease HII n=1 Tax=Maribacter algarum (ex Zhang et al. 2020) TaxID=2578118 RepID=A0A5S3PEB9_9FLAO|nr:ribonuclease HII [Maribacter algarum]TMM52227.1 ribonuclease HII [Maribacter algarum]
MKFRILVPVLFLLFNCSDKDDSVKPLLSYVPENAFLIVKIEDHNAFKNTIENNEFLSALSPSNTFERIRKKVEYLKYLSPKSESILALTETTDSRFEFLYVTDNTADLVNLDSIQNKSVESLKFANSTFDKYTVENVSFYTLITSQKVIISSSKLLLEQLDGAAATKLPETLQKLYNITGKNKPASIFINLNTGNRLLSNIFKEESEIKTSGFSDWIALDVNNTSKSLNLSGVSIANDQTWNYIDLLANTRPTTNTTASFAPSQADAILSYTFDDYTVFAKNRELSSGVVSPVDPPMNSVEEIGIIYIKDEKAVVLNTYGAEGISEYLNNQKKGVIEYQGLEILNLEKNDFLNNRFSPVVKGFKTNFCVLLKDAFIFTETEAVLKTIIRDYKNASTYSKTSVFKTLNDVIAKESSILFVSNSGNITKILENDFSVEFSNDLKKVKLSQFGLAAQTIADRNFYHTNLVIQKINPKISSTKSATNLFTVDFDSDLVTNPQFVTNHITKRKEIIAQDENNVLYLISTNGKILWKKQLSGMLQGKVKQVDIFKNGRLQLAFTTNNQFLVLDRNGKEVTKFTKTYEGGNLNPLAVFDYDKKKNYRFVVTQGEKTFMYDSKATIVKGFKYTKAEQPIIAAPKHIVINYKDFLVFKLKDGSLKLLSRVGDVRTAVSEKIDFSENEVFRYKNKFSVTDKKGVLHQVDLNGKVTKTNFNLSNDHGMAATDNTLVLMNDNILTIKGKKIELELGVYSKPQVFYINNKIYVSVTDLQNEKVYLYDSQAKPIKNFPVNGSSIIDLGDLENNKTLELVAKENGKTLVVHKI